MDECINVGSISRCRLLLQFPSGKLSNGPLSQFSHLKNGANNRHYFIGLFGKLNELIQIKRLEHGTHQGPHQCSQWLFSLLLPLESALMALEPSLMSRQLDWMLPLPWGLDLLPPLQLLAGSDCPNALPTWSCLLYVNLSSKHSGVYSPTLLWGTPCHAQCWSL